MHHEPARPFEVVQRFEIAIGEYTGAPFVVAVNSCTMALRLCLDYFWAGPGDSVEIPSHTYVGVPAQIKQAGYNVKFRKGDWLGAYQLKPFNIWDSARWFTGGMFDPAIWIKGGGRSNGPTRFICLSFHASKTLGIEQGGAILHNAGHEVDSYFRAMRFDGRIEGQPITNETVKVIGHHCYMSPSVAAQGLLKLHSLPQINHPLDEPNYPDLSKFKVFK